VSELTLNDMLSEFRVRKWTLHLFGPRGAPDVYATTFQWQTCADVFVLRDEHPAFAYRVLTFPGTDVFRPQTVAWDYYSQFPAWALRAVLTIPPLASPVHRCRSGRRTPSAGCQWNFVSRSRSGRRVSSRNRPSNGDGGNGKEEER
jgi:hypothetical protein